MVCGSCVAVRRSALRSSAWATHSLVRLRAPRTVYQHDAFFRRAQEVTASNRSGSEPHPKVCPSIDKKYLGGYMAHYSTLRGYDLSASTGGDVRGAKVYGRNDKELGKINDVIFDHTSGNITYVVIDTGGWLTTKKFLVPANQ